MLRNEHVKNKKKIGYNHCLQGSKELGLVDEFWKLKRFERK